MEFARAQGVETVGVRPGKGVHLMFAGRVTNYAVIFHGIDGRQMFICPHQNTTLLGTTDDDYYGDLSQIPVLESEVAYLLQAAERMFPSIGQYPLIGTTVGCRATLHEWGPYESDLGRDHRIWDHEESGAAGFMTMAGGKLASYRVMAEEATNAICQRLGGFGGACETGSTPLPGGHEHDLGIEAFTELGLSGAAARRILYRHGSRAEQIRSMMVNEPRTRALVDPLEPVTEAEIRHVIRTEHVVTVDDLKRRSRLGIASDGAARCAVRASQILAEELDIEPDLVPELARDFLQSRWEDRRGIRRAGTCEMEAVTQAVSHLSAQTDRARPGRAR
jgi:glycerol-3-phosphate dehydrogenase